ncbi:cation-translocating P-type ATPase [Chitinophaga filiformis]|uniref:cation-translocating P-type ATPase n=1 Tax=Chitinophaga filiformis TaxID=104663 RepID=UPI001F3CACBD|nr:cation-translocating P-type ATPase [Chitinophaga filiformis]MCF6405308.1 cation-translocating P-type ATPase [Chitinophaga filiformis]
MNNQLSNTAVIKGLRTADVDALQQRFGKNVFTQHRRWRLWAILKNIVTEPMFLLLAFAAGLYFLLNSITEGMMMLTAILLVSAISFYQEMKSERALDALKQYTAPLAVVIRDGREIAIATTELVPGDILLLHEGDMVPADAVILSANDLAVNESVITGESFPVEKQAANKTPLYQGSTINSGACTAVVTNTGNNTTLGKLGKAIASTADEKTVLQRQTQVFVKQLALFGIAGFAVVFLLNFMRSGDWAASLLLGLTLAMAAIPEEIPVSFSSFMALGAYYMSRMGIIPRQAQIVENLGAANVLCLDKTGTLTENRMKVVMLYDHINGQLHDLEQKGTPGNSHLLYIAALASERHPFDNMECAIVASFLRDNEQHIVLPGMIHEYPLEGKPPMMTHVYPQGETMLAAAKGAVERILRVCHSDQLTREKIMAYVNNMGRKGFRVLGVASAVIKNNMLPAVQDDADWRLEGLIALYDPPRASAADVISKLYEAGFRIMLLTGDHLTTASYIAARVGIYGCRQGITGDEVMRMDEKTLLHTVREEALYVRMYPEAKRKVIEALKSEGFIVAMTGDGVNDGPAIKAAHIGIAMGKKGTEIARQAADLIITNDNLAMIPVAVEQGRRIYSNLKKAIRYIISIHIPIILVATVPLLLGWRYPNIFTPIHVIFLELIMGPTCSLFYEKEPVEDNIMQTPPRQNTGSLFSKKELFISILQGLIIAAGILVLYSIYMQEHTLEKTRTFVFTTLLISNIFLTFTNRSFTENFIKTIRYHNSLAPLIIGLSVLFLVAIQLVPGIRLAFGLTPLNVGEYGICLATGFLSVAWFEIYKQYLPPAS